MSSNFKVKYLIICLVLLVVIGVFVLIFKPTIEVYYNNEITDNIEIEVGSSIGEFKSSSKYIGKDISKEIKVNNEVDTSKVGEYTVNFNIKKFIYNVNKKVSVKVVDKTYPVITLAGKNPGNACGLDRYNEEGYTAIDNYDGDITDKVKVTNDNGFIKYEVTDSSGNTTSVNRDIITSDTEKPIIKLNGNEDVFVELNNKYEEEGYTVTDNCDKSFDNVIVENNVDTSKEGDYVVKYIVTDTSNNTNTVIRNVYVYNPETNIEATDVGTNNKGVIYLTFDDGPSIYTKKILDVLKKYNIKATFFVTKLGKDEYIKREYKEGHTVAIHTYSHSYKTVYSSVKGFFNDISKVEKRVYRITKYKPTILRFPGGSSNTISRGYKKGIMKTLTKEVTKRGYHYFDWNFAIEDCGPCAYKKSNKARESCVFNYFKKGLSKKRSNVVLMHDIKPYTASKLEDMIKYAIAKGYTFDKITMSTPEVHHKVNN